MAGPSTYDIHIQPLPPDEQSVIRGVFGFGTTRTIAIRGVQRLANKWLLEFFTARGSDPLDLRRGTLFPSLIGSNVANRQSLVDVVYSSVADATAAVSRRQAANGASLDECVGSVEVVSLDISDDNTALTLAVRLTSASGASALLTVPTKRT